MARIAFGGFRHETNTFAPVKADLEDYQIGGAYPPLTRGEALFDAIADMNISVSGYVDEARAQGHELVPLTWCAAVPSAHTTERAFETVSAWLLEDIAAAGALDALYLDLHGAMVVEHFEDGEGELLRRVRGVVGADMPVVSSLDYHSNTTPQMIELTTVMDAYRTYPHVDRGDTGRRAARHLNDLVQGNGATVKAFRQIPYIMPLTWQCTETEPAMSIIETLKSLEGDGVSTLSFTAGFPLADILHSGPAVFGYGRDRAAVENAVNALAEEVEGREKEFAGTLYEPDAAVAKAMRTAATASRPVVISDTQDNSGAGGTSDTVGMLDALVQGGAEGAVMALVYDPETASQAHGAGMGAEIDVRLGGKSGFPGVAPYAGRFTVESLGDGRFTGTGPMFKGVRYQLGAMALLKIGGVRVAVSSQRTQAADQSILRHLGLEPAEQKILVLKSSVHFRADFAPIAEDILIAVAPGPNTADTRLLPYRNLRPGMRVSPLGEAFAPPG
ncbi:MAG: M81 family metallopeptidase [Rhodospirillales bacterium]|jgi:microcystin degradation protein MlrC|nr:M81 family metallopeptidase [Rhodospirillales bacterium]